MATSGSHSKLRQKKQLSASVDNGRERTSDEEDEVNMPSSRKNRKKIKANKEEGERPAPAVIFYIEKSAKERLIKTNMLLALNARVTDNFDGKHGSITILLLI